MPSHSESTSTASTRRRTDSKMISPAPSRISTPSIAAARFSTFACPYMCDSSAGSSAFRTEKKAITDARRSIAECAASVRIAIEPVTTPAKTLRTISAAFEAIETAATRVLRGESRSGPIRALPACIPAPRGRRRGVEPGQELPGRSPAVADGGLFAGVELGHRATVDDLRG